MHGIEPLINPKALYDTVIYMYMYDHEHLSLSHAF